MPRPSAPGAKEDIALVDVVAFQDVFSNLLFFHRVLEDINSVDRAVFEGDIESVKDSAVVRTGFVVNFFGFFGEDFAD